MGNTEVGGGSYGGMAYDSSLTPTDLGSGGGGAACSGTGGNGGGAIRLIVTDRLTVDGAILANGSAGGRTFCGGASGSGAGGSIWVTAGALAGSGALQANGGNGIVGGGGGRIAVYYQDGSGFSGYSSSTATGGTGAGGAGASGTAAFIDESVPGKHLQVYQTFDVPKDGTLDAFNQITVRENAVVRLSGAVTITTGRLSVEVGAIITADGQGYSGGYQSSGQGPGAGGSNSHWAGGGGHGGIGGGPYGGVANDSPLTPTALGSGGGGAACGGTGGNGGGAIRLIVTDRLTVDGAILANGWAGGRTICGGDSGSGAGGSIWVTAGTLTGSGALQANGGNGIVGGGGGRIAVYYQDGSGFLGYSSSTATGGAGDGAGGAGASGTVGFIDESVPGKHLQIYQAFDVPKDGTLDAFNQITVRENAVVRLSGAATVTAGSLTVEENAVVRLSGAATITADSF